MDFSLPTMFVVPVGNTLPTTGSTEDLTSGQFGITKNIDMAVVTASNIASANYIQIVQGRGTTSGGAYLGTKRSDKIKASKVKKWYKQAGCSTNANEIWKFSSFTAGCDEDITLTLRGHSTYLDTVSYNGFTRSITIKTPCCDCGEDPCDSVANETIIDLFLEKIAQENAVQNGPNKLNITTFWSFYKEGTGSSAVLVAEGAPLTSYSKFCNVALNPFEYDRIYFRGWVYKNPDVTVDFLEYDRCEQAAVAAETQRSTWARGSSDAITQMQIDYYSYQSDFKHLFQMSQYNQRLEDYVTAGTFYDVYYIIFNPIDQNIDWTDTPVIDETVIIAVPTGAQSTGVNAVLASYLGAVTDESGTCITTTTTSTTTSSTTSTTTTTLLP